MDFRKVGVYVVVGVVAGMVAAMTSTRGCSPETPRGAAPVAQATPSASESQNDEAARVQQLLEENRELEARRPTAEDATPAEDRDRVPASRRFERERRDPQWAADFERRIADKISYELQALEVPGEIQEMECRTSTCSFWIEVRAIDLNELMSWSDIVWIGDTGTLGDIEQPDAQTARLHVVLEFHPEHRDPDAFEAHYDEKRARALARRSQEVSSGGP